MFQVLKMMKLFFKIKQIDKIHYAFSVPFLYEKILYSLFISFFLLFIEKYK